MSAAECTHTFDGERFTLIRTGEVLGVTAKRVRGRWQYRLTTTGHLLASGLTPAAFVAKFWFGTLASND